MKLKANHIITITVQAEVDYILSPSFAFISKPLPMSSVLIRSYLSPAHIMTCTDFKTACCITFPGIPIGMFSENDELNKGDRKMARHYSARQCLA